ncbi:hypothetical protein ACP70R_048303 [Stipagrostis hirtigluma subsp. patula]
MRRGAGDGSGARVAAVEGEVHVQRVEKIIETVVDVAPAATAATTRGVVPPPPAAGGGGGKAARDVNELAEEFIRRNRAAFQGIRGHGGQKAINV